MKAVLEGAKELHIVEPTVTIKSALKETDIPCLKSWQKICYRNFCQLMERSNAYLKIRLLGEATKI